MCLEKAMAFYQELCAELDCDLLISKKKQQLDRFME